MKLNFEQIKAITEGAVKITEENGAYNFFRFTDAQTKTYENRGGYAKAFATAGVKMRFKTDSENLFIKVFTKEGGSSRKYFSFDVFKDGEILGYIKNFDEDSLPADYISEELPLGEFSGSFDLGEGKKVIQIEFPWSVVSQVLEISVDDGAIVTPVKKSKKLLAFGDSITHGYDALYPHNRYIAKVSEFLDAEEINKAIGGEMFYPLMAKEKDSFEPDFIAVAYGTNDWCHCGSYEQIFENCRGFYSTISKNYPNAKIFALSPIWREAYREEKPTGDFRNLIAMIKETTKDLENVTVIDCFDFVPKEGKYFADKVLHPNDEGFRFYAENVISEIKKELSK